MFKKIISLALAVVTCFSLTVPAFADEYSLNRNNAINGQILQEEPMIDLGGGDSHFIATTEEYEVIFMRRDVSDLCRSFKSYNKKDDIIEGISIILSGIPNLAGQCATIASALYYGTYPEEKRFKTNLTDMIGEMGSITTDNVNASMFRAIVTKGFYENGQEAGLVDIKLIEYYDGSWHEIRIS